MLEELNVKSLVPCNDTLKYASLRAEPDFRYVNYIFKENLSIPALYVKRYLGVFFSVLGKRLGKSMGVVAKDVKAMSEEKILAFEKEGEVSIAGHCLKLSDIKVQSFGAMLTNTSCPATLIYVSWLCLEFGVLMVFIRKG